MASFLKLTLVGDGGVGSKNVLFLLLLLRRYNLWRYNLLRDNLYYLENMWS